MGKTAKQTMGESTLAMQEIKGNTFEGVCVSRDYKALITRVWNQTVIVPAFIEGPDGFEGAIIKSVSGKTVELYTKNTLICKYTYDPDAKDQQKAFFEHTCEELQLTYVTKGR